MKDVYISSNKIRYTVIIIGVICIFIGFPLQMIKYSSMDLQVSDTDPCIQNDKHEFGYNGATVATSDGELFYIIVLLIVGAGLIVAALNKKQKLIFIKELPNGKVHKQIIFFNGNDFFDEEENCLKDLIIKDDTLKTIVKNFDPKDFPKR